MLICGGIGMGARMALEEAGVELLPGAAGNLEYDPDTACHHHDHEHGEGHECHHGNCGAHGCHS